MAVQEITFHWHCYTCGNTGDLSEDFLCPACGDPRSLRPDAYPGPDFFHYPLTGMWQYRDLLPVSDPVSIGEGATPLVDAPALAAHCGLGELRLKNETANPTGSFKDRQVSAGISHAREKGADTVAVVSSGNVAAATSAYAARAGMRAILFMHGQAGRGKIAQAAVYGAHVVCVDSPSPARVFELCLEACRQYGWYHLSTAGIYAPWNVEGAKTIAWELYQQYDGDLPDWIAAPVGGGGLLGGLWRGLLDLRAMGLIERLPKLAGIQAAGCAPLQEAIEKDWSFKESLAHPWPDPDTVAGGIADDILFDGHTAIPAVRETGGAAIAVGDPAIIEGMRTLAGKEGILCELTSAVVPAALPMLPGADRNTRVCALVTGSGIKEIPWLTENAPEPLRIAPSLEALEAVLP
jgi:threonine synthase